MKLFFTCLFCLCMSLPFSHICSANSDHIEARDLSLHKKILPLDEILKRIKSHQLGTILNIELEKEDHQIIYEIEFLNDDNLVFEIHVDAKTAVILKKQKVEKQ